MDSDLRIPMTTDMKQTIVAAAGAEQMDVAAWVRPILLREANKRLSKPKR
jgi:hypothetical protein